MNQSSQRRLNSPKNNRDTFEGPFCHRCIWNRCSSGRFPICPSGEKYRNFANVEKSKSINHRIHISRCDTHKQSAFLNRKSLLLVQSGWAISQQCTLHLQNSSNDCYTPTWVVNICITSDEKTSNSRPCKTSSFVIARNRKGSSLIKINFCSEIRLSEIISCIRIVLHTLLILKSESHIDQQMILIDLVIG